MKKMMDLDLKNLDKSGNILFDENEGYCSIRLSSKIYSLNAIKFAAHHMAEDANIIIDAVEKDTVSLEIFLKDKKKSIKDVFWKFNEVLIGYSTYLIQSDRNKTLRNAILKKALDVEKTSKKKKKINKKKGS
jgi:hypothetical protein